MNYQEVSFICFVHILGIFSHELVFNKSFSSFFFFD